MATTAIKFIKVRRDQIDDMMKLNPQKTAIFMDETGRLYFVDQGDLTLWELRQMGKKAPSFSRAPAQEKEKNPFLEEDEGFLQEISFENI